ncbi:MAG: hypothetical protein HY710_06205, partial [Candidatus Latescibacteria bacterium]|nr:hypothetical protein [Candidatus Latescibacterota bacterium]
REENLYGNSVEYFYKEEADSNERLLVAILVGGDKAIRFRYTARTTNIATTYLMPDTPRKVGHLLDEITVLDGCVPVQTAGSARNEVSTSFAACANATVTDRIRIAYADPNERYTGRYVMSSWQHESGDGSVTYPPVRFEYNGDDRASYDERVNATDVNPSTSTVLTRVDEDGTAEDGFRVPDGFTLGSSAANGAPFQMFTDFNADGLPDWVFTHKARETEYWPNPASVDDEHKIYVKLRNTEGGFHTARSYDDPLADHAVWLWKGTWHTEGPTGSYCTDTSGVLAPVRRDDDLDTFYYDGDNNTVVCSSLTHDNAELDPASCSDADFGAAATWQGVEDTGIGIDMKPWIRVKRDPDSPTGIERTLNHDQSGCHYMTFGYSEPQPAIFESFSMTVPCSRFGGIGGEVNNICEEILVTYNDLWTGCTWVNEPGVASTNGIVGAEHGFEPPEDGTNADCAIEEDVNIKLTDLQDMNGDGFLDRVVSGLIVLWDAERGFRNPRTDDPAIYVSLFDPGQDRFLTFRRYDVPNGGDGVYDYSNSFLSALAIERMYNGSSAGSLAAGGSGLGQVIGMAAGLYNGVTSFLGADPKKMAFRVLNLYLQGSGVSPELRQAVQVAMSMKGFATSASQAADAFEAARQWGAMANASSMANRMGRAHADLMTQQAALAQGWNAVAAAIGIAFDIAKLAAAEIAKTRMEAAGYNGAVVAHRAAITQAALNVGKATAELAVCLTPAVPLCVLAVGDWLYASYELVHEIYGIEGSLSFEQGEVRYDVKDQRGIVYRDSLEAAGWSHQVSNWMDLDSDGQPDLVIGRKGTQGEDWAIARGNIEAGETAYAAEDLVAWSIGGGGTRTGHLAISKSTTTAEFRASNVHRAELMNQVIGLMDINGDGRADLVDTSEESSTTYAPEVYLNTGTGFAAPVTWRMDYDANNLPSVCDARPHLARVRALSWQEFEGNREAWTVGMTNLVEAMGPDIDQNGLPDIVIKDESQVHDDDAYDGLSRGNDCMHDYSSSMCASAMPVQTEPDPHQSACTSDCSDDDAAELWFTTLDNDSSQACHSEGSVSANGEGASHLTKSARDLYSPKMSAIHYVAFNTGRGFTRFVSMTEPIPSFGGSFTLVKAVNTSLDVPELALSGASNFLADADADGRPHLVTMDIHQETISELAGPNASHPVASEWAIGIRNPDALVRIEYPDGGASTIYYEVKKVVYNPASGPLLTAGPPRWVFSEASFDDGRPNDWNVADPELHYAYDHPIYSPELREWLGYGAIVETRSSGTDFAQVLHSFYQLESDHSPSVLRGAPKCIETRGRAMYDSDVAGRVSCGSGRVESPPLADDEGNVESCYDDIDGLELRTVYPLQARSVQRYEDASERTAYLTLDDGTTEEILRDFNLTRVRSSVFNGSANESWMENVVSYDAAPYKTPTAARVTTSDGLRRSTATEWKHQLPEWIFLKESETQYDERGDVGKQVLWVSDNASPFAITREVQVDGRTGETRTVKEYGTRTAATGGQPSWIVDAGVRTDYTYYGDSEHGTGNIKTSQREADSRFQTTSGVESWEYDAGGRIRRAVNAAGAESIFNYDALGLLESMRVLGMAPVMHSHQEIGNAHGSSCGSDRSRSYLECAQRSIEEVTANGETLRKITWWDGFGRAYRRG